MSGAVSDCIFCKIVEGTIPSTKVYESANVLAFRDIMPAAPVHILVIPKRHIPTMNDVLPEDGGSSPNWSRRPRRLQRKRASTSRATV
ncbi:hypothetical protein BN871_AK_00070 [Paenibacillus sp. P22]|nr:hypothetical protein BN871_AK_00070 [Paenibacillus sp. P22]